MTSNISPNAGSGPTDSNPADTVDLSAPEEELKAYFGRTATPTQRIHLWLDQIETTAKAVQAEIDKTLGERQRAADAAATRYEAILTRELPDDSEELRQAVKGAFGGHGALDLRLDRAPRPLAKPCFRTSCCHATPIVM